MDWKDALALDLDDPGFDASILSTFRARLLAAGAEERPLTIALDTLVDAALLKERGRQRRDSTHVMGQLRTLSRLALVGETMRAALNDLAEVAPNWLLAHLDPAWAERDAVRVEEYRLPNATADRKLLEVTIGTDGDARLDAVFAADAPPICGNAQRCRSCGRSGFSRTTARTTCAGAAARICHPMRGCSPRPTRRRPASPRSARPRGPATRCL